MRQRKHQLGRLAAWGFALSLALASSAQEIAFSSPAAGDAWQVGATHTVRWTSSGYEGKRLVINYDGLDVADKVPVEDGQFAWAIPWEVAAKTGCTLSISVDGQSKATSGAFSLVAKCPTKIRYMTP